MAFQEPPVWIIVSTLLIVNFNEAMLNI